MKSILFIFVLLIAFTTQAQNKIAFTKNDSSKTITIKQKDLARLRFNGYMNQPQEVEGYVSAITDSSISLAPRKKFLQKRPAPQTILINDITGFRQYSKFRPAAEIIYSVLGVGITGAVSAIVSKGSTSTITTILSTAATGAVTTSLKNVIFSHKIKNNLAKGWTTHLLQNQAPAAK
jgi:hypothetical protein